MSLDALFKSYVANMGIAEFTNEACILAIAFFVIMLLNLSPKTHASSISLGSLQSHAATSHCRQCLPMGYGCAALTVWWAADA